MAMQLTSRDHCWDRLSIRHGQSGLKKNHAHCKWNVYHLASPLKPPISMAMQRILHELSWILAKIASHMRHRPFCRSWDLRQWWPRGKNMATKFPTRLRSSTALTSPYQAEVKCYLMWDPKNGLNFKSFEADPKITKTNKWHPVATAMMGMMVKNCTPASWPEHQQRCQTTCG